ncbi:eCIS core domain-containing protein [Chitinimonas taiwanensis]|uniref:eCIS core domain-containing protein n=1 Tax=Chitinimonas taiwanensis TaxID=240412 RepID=UPI0035AF063C
MKTQQQTPLTQAAKPAARHEPDGPWQQQIDASPRQQAQQQRLAQLQAAAHPNGLPAPLQQGLEALSGLAMHDVRVHRNSDKPAQLQAHAYAQGRDIYLAPGQERHLAHEAWHIVQQKQGRVSATRQMPAGVGVNDDPGLEQEADRMGAQALQAHADGAPLASRSAAPSGYKPVQCVIYKKPGKGEKDVVTSLERTGFYKALATDLEKKWARYLHGKTGEHYSYEEARAKITELIDARTDLPDVPDESQKKKRKFQALTTDGDNDGAGEHKKPKRIEPTVARVTGPATGTQVDYGVHPKFRTERRTIRRLKKVGVSVGDKNIYVKRFKPVDGGKPYKLITSSIPPSSLPNDYSEQDIDELTASRLGQSLHSEAVNDRIEQHYAPWHGRDFAAEEAYSTSSREQCEGCRYHHVPHKPGAHYFGTKYSGKTDHIADKDLRERVVNNKGVIKGLDLTDAERKVVEEADQDAAAARQFDPDQNPLLTKSRRLLSKDDSDGEHSSDDDDLFVEQALYWGDTGWGKGEVNKIPRRAFFQDAEFQEAKQRTQTLIKEKAEKPPKKRKERGFEASTTEGGTGEPGTLVTDLQPANKKSKKRASPSNTNVRASSSGQIDEGEEGDDESGM